MNNEKLIEEQKEQKKERKKRYEEKLKNDPIRMKIKEEKDKKRYKIYYEKNKKRILKQRKEDRAKTGEGKEKKTRRSNITGQIFGKLKVIEDIGNVKKHSAWLCKCECGKEKIALATNLLRGITTHCGCYKPKKIIKRKDFTGKKNNKLTAIRFIEVKNGMSYWLYQCDCGKEIIAAAAYVNSNRKKSCGCKRPGTKNYETKLSSIEQRLYNNLTGRAIAIFKKKKQKRYFSFRKLIGCSLTELKIHLENKFTEGMNWENYGKKGWEIDHIYPLIKLPIKTKEQQLKAFSYQNLQPLWMIDNRKKSSKVLLDIAG